jgi:UDP-N-acetylmuramyl tripeptide synthase
VLEAGEDDLVLLAGMGHERCQTIGKTARESSDHELGSAAHARRSQRI